VWARSCAADREHDGFVVRIGHPVVDGHRHVNAVVDRIRLGYQVDARLQTSPAHRTGEP
jgi:hypothetical protein